MKSVVLLSSGLDSTVNLFEAHAKGQVLLNLTFHYGQRAAKNEVESAKKLSSYLGIPHQVIDLPFFMQFGKSSLVDQSKVVPQGKEVSIDDFVVSSETAKSVWVPNRNGIFLNIAAGFAESLGADYVIPGFNREEAVTFPDNSTEFLRVLDQSFSMSTSTGVRTHCFTDNLDKREIAARGKELGVPFSMIWPCYFQGEKWCGQCESCQRSLRAFKAAGVSFEV